MNRENLIVDFKAYTMNALPKIRSAVLTLFCLVPFLRADTLDGTDSTQNAESEDSNEQQNDKISEEETVQRSHSNSFLSNDQSQNQAFQNLQNQSFKNQQNQWFQNQQHQALQNQQPQAFQNQGFRNQAYQNPYFQYPGYQYQTNPMYSSLLFPFLSYPMQNPAFVNQPYPRFGSFQAQPNPSIDNLPNPAIMSGHSTTIFNKHNEGNQNKIPGFDIGEPQNTPEDTASTHTTWFQQQM